MNVATAFWLALCALGFALSIKSISVLRRRSARTVAGWAATAAYFLIAGADAVRGRPAPVHLDYVALGVLVVAFIAAGIADEPQAEPWWWPSAAGPTGAERRARRP
jgi:hypothetical protein